MPTDNDWLSRVVQYLPTQKQEDRFIIYLCIAIAAFVIGLAIGGGL